MIFNWRCTVDTRVKRLDHFNLFFCFSDLTMVCNERSKVMIPVALETTGAIGPKLLEFLKELGMRARQQTGDERAASFILQRQSVAIQQGNATSILGELGG